MKYFTKYLPVEGEIKEGDLTRDHFGGGLSKCTKVHQKGIVTEHGFGPLDNYHVEKLFLCSRDIKVGDMMMYCPNPLKPTYNKLKVLDRLFCGENDTVVLEFGTAKIWTDPEFKVIGEVSPSAIWVKEGMEFEDESVLKEYEVECYYQHLDNQYEREDRRCDADKEYTPYDHETLLDDGIIKFKCPTCNTFH